MRAEILGVRPPEITPATIGKRIVRTALEYEGLPSAAPRGPEYGMSRVDGFSCTGFVTHVLNEAGIRLPPVEEQLPDGSSVKRPFRKLSDYHDLLDRVPWNEKQKGDLGIFYEFGPGRILEPKHIVILVSEGEQGPVYIHAPGWNRTQVRIEHNYPTLSDRVLETPELIDDYIGIRRIPAAWARLTPSYSQAARSQPQTQRL